MGETDITQSSVASPEHSGPQCIAGPILLAAEERMELDAIRRRSLIWKSSGAPDLGGEPLIRPRAQVSPTLPSTRPTQGLHRHRWAPPLLLPAPTPLLTARPRPPGRCVLSPGNRGIKKT